MLNLISGGVRGASYKILGLFLLFICGLAYAGGNSSQTGMSAAERSKYAAGMRAGFMENKGQWDKPAKFLGRRNGMDMWFTDKSVRFDIRESVNGRKQGKAKGVAVDMAFLGANPNSRAKGVAKRDGRVDFLIGRKKSVRGVQQYGGVDYRALYDNIDLKWYVDGGIPRFDFVVEPGGNPDDIKLRFKGDKGLKINYAGQLVVDTSMGPIYQADLMAYQVVNGKKVEVPASFRYIDDHTIGFAIANYDTSRQLVIDPLVYGSYYGGDSGFDEVHSVVADADFGVYITGYTQAPDFPSIAGPFGFDVNGAQDMFLSKFQGDAYDHDYSCYIGGSGVDNGWFVALSPDGNHVWVAGVSTSNDFPGIDGNSLFPARSGNSDIVFMRFTKDVDEVLVPDYATYYGTNTIETLRGMAVAPTSGDVIITGETNGGLPSTNNSYLGGQRDVYITAFQTDSIGMYAMRFSRYYGGTGTDTVGAVATDTTTNIYVAGTVAFDGNVDTSLNPAPFTTTPGVFPNGRLLRNSDAFIIKVDATGNFIFSALLGGNGHDAGAGIAVDSTGNAYITGLARSFNFPRTRGVYGENFNANERVFASKISPDGSKIVYSTHLNTNAPVIPRGIGVDKAGNAYVAGIVDFTETFPTTPGDPNEPQTHNPGSIPTTPDALDPDYVIPGPPQLGTTEGFLLALNSTASELTYGTYLGGDLDEQVFAPYVDRFGDVWTVGSTDSFRFYLRVSSTGTINVRQATGSLPPALLSQFAFKSSPDAAGDTNVDGVLYGLKESPFTPPPTINGVTYRRDGFLVKQRLSLPTIATMTINPSVIAGGLGATAIGTINLSTAAPAGGLDVTVEIDNVAASFDPNSPLNQITIPIPGGATTAQFTLYSTPVTDNEQVNVKATLEGNFMIRVLTVKPWLQELTVTPNTVVGGNQLLGRVKLEQNAINDITIDLSTDASGLVEFPGGSTVTVPAGLDTATFLVNTHGVEPPTDVPVTGSLLGVGRTDIVRLLPANLATVTFIPPRVTSGAISTGTVALDGEAGSTFTVDLSINPGTAGYVISPTTLTFEEGEKSKTFTVQTAYETSNVQRTITAHRPAQGGYIAETIAGNLFIDASALVSFTIDKSIVDSGEPVTGTLTISVPANTGGTPVNVTTDNPLVTVASPVSIPASATSVNFPIMVSTDAVANDTLVHITAQRGPVIITRDLTIRHTTATVSFNPTQVTGGASSTGTVSIAAPAPTGGLTFTLASNNPGAASPQAQVTIPEGQTSATFNVNTFLVGSTTPVTITATSGQIVGQGVLVVRAISVVSLTIVPSRAKGGSWVNLTVTIDSNAPGPNGVDVPLFNSNPVIANVPDHITIPAGSNTATIQVHTNRVSRTLSTQVQAAFGDTIAFALLTVTR